MEGHHLILGRLTDLISGTTLPDTHDERYRQKIAHLLVNVKGYAKTDLQTRYPLQVKAGANCALVKVDFVVSTADHIGMIVKYGPGSLVTRYRPALAASRLLAPYQIPRVVVTNGEAADILNGSDGRLLSSGFASIPGPAELARLTAPASLSSISAARAEAEARIVYAFEVDDSCPCDDTVCRL
jgi:hypothetical protein